MDSAKGEDYTPYEVKVVFRDGEICWNTITQLTDYGYTVLDDSDGVVYLK